MKILDNGTEMYRSNVKEQFGNNFVSEILNWLMQSNGKNIHPGTGQ